MSETNKIKYLIIKEDTPHHSRRHKKHAKSKKPFLSGVYKWIKRNPLKLVSFFFLVVLIYISVLFYGYEEDDMASIEEISNSTTVKGILLPKRLLSEAGTVFIKIGKTKHPVSLEELNQGYQVSPMKMADCGNYSELSDSTKFTLSLSEDRLFVTANFRYLLNGIVIGSVNQKEWVYLSEKISDTRTDDYSFELSDDKGNVIFTIQFIEPDTVSVQGYFVGTDCIYVINNNGIYSEVKSGNYIERILPEIKKIKKIIE